MKYLLLALLFSVSAQAEMSKVAIGAKSGERDAVIVHDFNTFSLLRPDMFDLNRYGFGRGQLELSDRIQLLAENRSGMLLDGENSGPKIGIEMFNGKIEHRGDLMFQWEPGLSAGYKVNAFIAGLYLGLRAGTSLEKVRRDDFMGAAGQIQLLGLSVNVFMNRYYKTKDELKIVDVNLGGRYNIQMQEDSRTERIYMAGVKW